MNAEIAAIYALPVLPLGVSWWRLIQRKLSGTASLLVLFIANLSYLWWFLPLLDENLVGSAHSRSRFLIMGCNTLALVVSAVVALLKPNVQISLGAPVFCLPLCGEPLGS